MRGIGPIVLLVGVFVVSFAFGLLKAAAPRKMHGTSSRRNSTALVRKRGNVGAEAALNALPLVLFICFCLCAPTSSVIFATWSCAYYTEDSLVRVAPMTAPDPQCHTT